jgi:hypothetical protein
MIANLEGGSIGIDGHVNIKLHERQVQALITPANEVLFGGAKGGGKSFLLRAAAIHWAARCPGIQIYLFRRQYPDLIANHMRGANNFHQLLAPLIKRKRCRIVGDKDIRFSNGSNIFLRHLATDADVMNYQGVEIHLLLMDELTHFTELMYRTLRTSVRLGDWQPPDMFRTKLPKIICGTNPGSIGHSWVKQTFVDHGAYYLCQTTKKQGGMLRQFIPARAEDNPALLRNDPGYLDRLEGMGNAALVKAMREGDWNAVFGAAFGDIWRHSLHVLPRAFAIPASWDIWRGGDDGYASPASIHWLAQDKDIGTIYVIREIYETRLLPEALGSRILRTDKAIKLFYGEGDYDYNDEDLSGELDSAAFNDTGTGKPSRGKQMNIMGCRWRPVDKPKGSRIARVQLMHHLLSPNPRDPDGFPRMRFFPNCEHAIRTIPTLPTDPDDSEDVDTEAEDHAFDSITYGASRKKKFFKKARVRGI